MQPLLGEIEVVDASGLELNVAANTNVLISEVFMSDAMVRCSCRNPNISGRSKNSEHCN